MGAGGGHAVVSDHGLAFLSTRWRSHRHLCRPVGFDVDGVRARPSCRVHPRDMGRTPGESHHRVTMIVGRVIRAAIRNAILLSMTRLPRGPHITRYHMYRRLEEVVKREHASGRILSISWSLLLLGLFGLYDSQIKSGHYSHTIILLLFISH